MDIILATNNKGKIREIKDILDSYNIYSLSEANISTNVIEDKNSFYENALKKAREIYKIAKKPVMADDSGLCIDALGNFPGVMTHRFLGEGATDEERNTYLIRELENKKNRNAKVVCAIVYYDGTNTISSEGIINGIISYERRGKNGFGFDEIFELSDGRTLAELSKEEKNKMSARYIALRKLKEKLETLSN